MAPVFQAAAVGAEPTGTGYVLGMDTTSYDLGAVRLHALEAGVGGAPLLLVHGFTGCKEDFAEEVDGLAELGYHVVAPDLRGHGESDQPDDEASYGLRSFADDLFALTERLGWASFDLLGHSMGGMIAQVMVLEQPDRVERLEDSLGANERIRTVGTRNLIAAAGPAKVIAQSTAFPAATAEHERLVLDAGGVILRYGYFYGPDTWYPDELPPAPRVQIDDAARRTVEALDAPAGSILEIVD